MKTVKIDIDALEKPLKEISDRLALLYFKEMSGETKIAIRVEINAWELVNSQIQEAIQGSGGA